MHHTMMHAAPQHGRLSSGLVASCSSACASLPHRSGALMMRWVSQLHVRVTSACASRNVGDNRGPAALFEGLH